MDTIHWLASQPEGATWDEICRARRITRGNWRAQLEQARKWFQSHQDFGYAIPRATRDGGFRFRVTNEMRSADPTVPDIRKGQIGDVEFRLAILTRERGELEVAYDEMVTTEPAGKRSVKARKILARMGSIEVQIEQAEKDIVDLRAM